MRTAKTDSHTNCSFTYRIHVWGQQGTLWQKLYSEKNVSSNWSKHPKDKHGHTGPSLLNVVV